MVKPKRDYVIGQRVAERPRRSTGQKGPIVACYFPLVKNAKGLPPKRGEIIDIEERKVKSKTAKAGYSLRKILIVQWDKFEGVDKVPVERVVHEHELSPEF